MINGHKYKEHCIWKIVESWDSKSGWINEKDNLEKRNSSEKYLALQS